MKKTTLFVSALCLAAGAHAGCYTVLDAKGKILSQTSTPPVDMSYQLHQTVPYKYGKGATMVFGIADGACGQEADIYEALAPTKLAWRDSAPRKTPRKRARAPRRDRR